MNIFYKNKFVTLNDFYYLPKVIQGFKFLFCKMNESIGSSIVFDKHIKVRLLRDIILISSKILSYKNSCKFKFITLFSKCQYVNFVCLSSIYP